MISSIHITNFQSHKESHLEFHPGVNAIIGQSDSGKTSILRALKWAVTNRPGGDSFRSSWGGDTGVSITFNNSSYVERKKTNSENLYAYSDGEGAAQILKAFGMDVPEDIQTILNLNEINIQNQLDLPFLLRDPPGQVASHFNKVAHLDAIDKSIQQVEKWTRELQRQIKTGEQDIKEKEINLEQYSYLDAMESEIQEAEKQEHKLQEKIKKNTSFIELLGHIQTTEKSIAKHYFLLSFETIVNQACDKISEIQIKSGNSTQLSRLIYRIKQKTEKINQLSTQIKPEEEINQALQKLAGYQKQNRTLQILTTLLKNINKIQIQIKQKEKQIVELENTFKQNMPEICPLCGQEVK